MMKMKLWVIGLALLLVACGRGCAYSDGDRVGVVTKFSKKGLVCKTWEGELVMGGMRNMGEGGVAANVWEFTVDDPKLVDAVKAAMVSEKRAKLSYHEGRMTGLCYANTSYFITAVEMLE